MGGRGQSYSRDKLKQQLGSGGHKGTAHPIDIQKYEGKTLEQIEGKLRKLKREQLVVLDANDKPVAAYQGDAHSVAFPAKLVNEKGATVTHGHPKGAAEFGGTFSFADVKNMAMSQWKEHRATASGQGEMNYILRRNSKSTPRNAKALLNKLNKEENKVMAKAGSVYDKAYDKAIKQGKSKKQALHQARQEFVGEIDRYWSKTLPKYGIDYVKRKKDYRYGR